MPHNQIDHDLIERAHRFVTLWNNGDLDVLAYRFREDAVLSSPFSEGEPPDWIHGREEIKAHLNILRLRHVSFSIIDIFSDRRFHSILIADRSEYLSVVIEPDEVSSLIRRMIICRSLMHSKIAKIPGDKGPKAFPSAPIALTVLL